MRLLAALLLTTLPCASLAQQDQTPAQVESTAHRHLGFFFRADIGAGYVHNSGNGSGLQPPVSALSIPIGLAVGGAVAEDWILAGEIWGIAGPENVNPPGKGLLVYGYALAIVHYFMPANVYVSIAPGVSRLMFVTADVGVSSDWGPGGKLAIGKEWWVGDHWGLGIAAELLVSFNKQGGDPRTTLAPGLTFSATFN
jgi:hypothetical protein